MSELEHTHDASDVRVARSALALLAVCFTMTALVAAGSARYEPAPASIVALVVLVVSTLALAGIAQLALSTLPTRRLFAGRHRRAPTTTRRPRPA